MKPIVFMYGGGRQSITICCLVIEGKLPVPDVTIIADTGREKETTWTYLDTYVRPKYPARIHRVSRSEWATVDLWSGADGNTLLIPAFTNYSGYPGKLETFCSDKWKVRVCDRYLKRTLNIHDCVKWIGFSRDEQKRIQPKRKTMGDSVCFPLNDLVPMTKQECAVYPAKSQGWPIAIHSACWMCPLQNQSDWKANTPEDEKKAIAFDSEMRVRDPHAFLNHAMMPLDQWLKIVRGQGDLFTPKPCDSGMCMT
jgi:3'-phosphoadenosine 5'-phosphosulfate sulfotransferase (PAPS reductase)/FAD synthetase